MGGLNDSHVILWPETATQDLSILEERFYEYITNMDKRIEVIQYAWNKLWEYYSYESVKKKLDQIIVELK